MSRRFFSAGDPVACSFDLRDPVVLLQRHRVAAAHVADRGERRLQAAERLDGRAGADELVVVEDKATLMRKLGRLRVKPRADEIRSRRGDSRHADIKRVAISERRT